MSVKSIMTDIANAVRAKVEVTGVLNLDQMINYINSIIVEGYDENADNTLLTSVMDKTVTSISSNVRKVGKYAFYNCNKLTTVDFPLLTEIDSHAFNRCISLTSVNSPLVTRIEQACFYRCSNLETVNMPLITELPIDAFYLCEKLTSVYFPLVTEIGDTSLCQCNALTTVTFPRVVTIGADAFSYSSNIERVDLHLVTYISNLAFASCRKLKTVIIRTTSICQLYSANVFTTTPISSTTDDGYVYVPKSLEARYKTATHWTTYANKIRAIEDYPEITGGV